MRNNVRQLVYAGLTLSQACKQFVQIFQKEYQNNLNFQLQNYNRPKFQRQRCFNPLYIKYCEEQFSGRNGSEDLLEQKILRVLKKKQKVEYQKYNKGSACVVATVTLLITRIQNAVIIFRQFLQWSFNLQAKIVKTQLHMGEFRFYQ